MVNAAVVNMPHMNPMGSRLIICWLMNGEFSQGDIIMAIASKTYGTFLTF